MSSGPDQITDALENQPSPDNQGESQGGEQPTTLSTAETILKTFNRGLYPDSEGNYIPIDPKVAASIQAKIDEGRKRGIESPNREVQTEGRTGFTNPPIYSEDVSAWPLDMSKTKSVSTPTMDRLRQRKLDYNLFQDYAGKQFTHLFDYFSGQYSGLGEQRVIPSPKYENGKIVDANTHDIYLGSYVKSYDENEDPTYLGYDLKIKELESPLFNGIAQDFIQQFGSYGNTEIASRGPVLARFISQLKRFLRTDVTTGFTGVQWENVEEPHKKDAHGVKTYYMKKISGLNNLVESYDGAEGKQFVEYGKDFITLTFNEDVSQNIGYLGYLYKLLSYSRLNGKLILPPNVLRFDVELEITEVRKMNRYFRAGMVKEGQLTQIADKIAKYTYTLYECEFFFPSLPHGDSLDMSAISEATDYEIKFNYKWASSKFTRFDLLSQTTFPPPTPGGTGGADTPKTENKFLEDKLDNKHINPFFIRPSETDNNKVGNPHIYSEPRIIPATIVRVTTEEGVTITPADKKGGDLQAVKEAAEKGNNTRPEPTESITDTTNVTVDTTKGTGKSIGDQLASSAIQGSIESSSIIGPASGKIQEALAQVNKSIAFPEIKGFATGILGGGIGKVVNDFSGKASGFAKGFIDGKLNEVTSSIINPIKKGFNLNILGGGLGGSLGSIGKNLLSGGGSNLKGKLNDILSGTIAPKIKGFATGLLGKGLLKTSGIVESLGLPKNLIGGLNKIASTTIAPAIKGFSLGMAGKSFGAALGSLGKGLASNTNNLKSVLNNVLTGTIAPKIKGFSTGLLGKGLLKTSGIVESLGLPKNLIGGLTKITSATISPSIKGFNLGMAGKSFGSALGSLGKGLASNTNNLKSVLNNVLTGTIAPKVKGFATGLLGKGLLKTSGIVENLGLSKEVGQKLGQIANNAIAPLTKGFNVGMIGGLLSGSSGLAKTLSNTKITDGLAQLTKSVTESGNKGFNLNILGGALSAEAGNIAKKVSTNVNETLEKAKNNLIDSGIKTINKSLLSQASLLDKTLGNISSQKNPTQNPIKSQLAKSAAGARNFVGRSLKSFFTK